MVRRPGTRPRSSWSRRRPAAGSARRGRGGRRRRGGRRGATWQLQGEGQLAVDRVPVLADDPEHGPVPPRREAVRQRAGHRGPRHQGLLLADGATVRPGDGEGGERRADRVVELQDQDLGAVLSTAPSAGLAFTRTAWAEAGAAEVTADVNAPARVSAATRSTPAARPAGRWRARDGALPRGGPDGRGRPRRADGRV